MLGINGSSKIVADDTLKYFFFFFSEKIRLDITCEWSVQQMIHMKCQPYHKAIFLRLLTKRNAIHLASLANNSFDKTAKPASVISLFTFSLHSETQHKMVSLFHSNVI